MKRVVTWMGAGIGVIPPSGPSVEVPESPLSCISIKMSGRRGSKSCSHKHTSQNGQKDSSHVRTNLRGAGSHTVLYNASAQCGS